MTGQENVAPVTLQVIGYHGTSGVRADRIAAGNWFRPSQDGWLGPGVYFFVNQPGLLSIDAVALASGWSQRRDQEKPAVLKANLDLRRCLDLLNNPHHLEAFHLARRRCRKEDSTISATSLDKAALLLLKRRLDFTSVRAFVTRNQDHGLRILTEFEVQVVVGTLAEISLDLGAERPD